MIYGLFSHLQFCGGGEWFAGAWVANEARMGATGDLEANALTTAEAVGGRPDVDLDV